MVVGTRNHAIDCLRGMSILWVVIFHIQLQIPLKKTAIEELLSPTLSTVIFRSGYYGVIVFFVISGFLITNSAVQRWGSLHAIDYRRFYILRFARIAPCLGALLLVLVALHAAGLQAYTVDTVPLWRALVSALTFHVNWLEATTGYLPGAWGVLWSLSVEEAFYLCFPLFCLVVRTRPAFVVVMFAFVLLGPFARVVFDPANDIWSDHSYLSGADGIALGCMAALVANQLGPRARLKLAFVALGLALSVFIFCFRKEVYELGLTKLGLNVTLLELGIALLLVGIHQHALTPVTRVERATAGLAWMGKNSYEIYLTHVFCITPVVAVFVATGKRPELVPIAYLVTIALCVALGHIVSRWYSNPANRYLRSRFGVLDRPSQRGADAQRVWALSGNGACGVRQPGPLE